MKIIMRVMKVIFGLVICIGIGQLEAMEGSSSSDTSSNEKKVEYETKVIAERYKNGVVLASTLRPKDGKSWKEVDLTSSIDPSKGSPFLLMTWDTNLANTILFSESMTRNEFQKKYLIEGKLENVHNLTDSKWRAYVAIWNFLNKVYRAQPLFVDTQWKVSKKNENFFKTKVCEQKMRRLLFYRNDQFMDVVDGGFVVNNLMYYDGSYDGSADTLKRSDINSLKCYFDTIGFPPNEPVIFMGAAADENSRITFETRWGNVAIFSGLCVATTAAGLYGLYRKYLRGN